MMFSVGTPPLAVGMFDSGIGGFTVLKELRKLIPEVPVLYFGDTYHVPYGGRPLEQIREFALNAMQFLISEGAGVIAIACNVSSSVITDIDRYGLSVPVFALIAGGAQHAVNLSRNGRIGVIATVATVNGGSYQKEILVRSPSTTIVAVPCPKFVPLVEAGERDTIAVQDAVEEYLTPILDAGCDTLVHGCTHYPFLEEAMKKFVKGRLTFIDPGQYLALDVARYIAGIAVINGNESVTLPESKIYLSAESSMFVTQGSEFLGYDISKLIEVRNINAEISKNWGK